MTLLQGLLQTEWLLTDDVGTGNCPQGETGKTSREGAVRKVGGENARKKGRETEAS